MKHIEKEDSSIQDITGNKFQIPSMHKISYPGGVPSWPTDPKITPDDLLKLPIEHEEFYNQFKQSFETSEYIDLEGNVNYLIVLVHEIALDFALYEEEDEFEEYLDKIEANYPEFKLKRAAVYQLVEGIKDKIEEFEDESDGRFVLPPVYLSDLALKLEDSLQLNLTELKRISQVLYKQNKFNQYTPIQEQIARFYLKVYEFVEEAYNKKQKSLSRALEKIEDDLFDKEKLQTAEGGKLIYFNNIWSQHLFTRIFNQCENVIRKHYSYYDLIIPAGIYKYDFTTGKIKSINEWESIVHEIIQQYTVNLEEPIEEYEKAFLQLKPSSWKIKYENIIKQYGDSPEKFLIAVNKLGKFINNTNNEQSLYFQAYSYMHEKDTITALTLYLYYSSVLQKKGVKNAKKISKIHENKLFQNRNQSIQFKELLSELTPNENLNCAIEKLTEIFLPKRKEIILDTVSIQNIQKSHSQTVELLAELLQDENEIISNNNNKNTKHIVSQTTIAETNPSNDSNDRVELSDIQKKSLEYIFSNNNRVTVKKFETFAREKGQFGNQLIESINELYYDHLGELLIEEEDGQYIVHKELLKN